MGKKEVQLFFYEAKSIAFNWRKQLEETVTPDELNQYANAVWHLCHNNNNDTTNNFVYDAFGDKILEQITEPELQFKQFLVGQLKQYNEVPESLWKSDQFLDLQIQEVDRDKMWQIFNPETQDYQCFGVASYKEYQLPIGTKVKGQIKGDLFTTARLDINHPQLKDTEVVIGNMTRPLAKVFRGIIKGYLFLNSPDFQAVSLRECCRTATEKAMGWQSLPCGAAALAPRDRQIEKIN
ncbi:MAG: hypothetical protein WBM32_01785 [Crocosphaera sp.]